MVFHQPVAPIQPTEPNFGAKGTVGQLYHKNGSLVLGMGMIHGRCCDTKENEYRYVGRENALPISGSSRYVKFLPFGRVFVGELRHKFYTQKEDPGVDMFSFFLMGLKSPKFTAGVPRQPI